MRTPASDGDRAAARYVVEQLWAAWSEACPPGVKPSVTAFARLAGVEAETLRVLVRSAGEGRLGSGPGFVTVAKLAKGVDVDLNQLARRALSVGTD